jgi:aminoglycoside phosphotransferase (APT) family kinase protein
MLAWDDAFFERPYSLWERVHGVTAGSAFPDDRRLPADRPTRPPPRTLWQAVGRELAKLHARVLDVPDPRGWLDRPEHANPRETLREKLAAGRIDPKSAESLMAMFDRDEPMLASAPRCFVHDDLHAENVLATSDGEFLAIIDWGDAGFGDPALDFQWMPSYACDHAIEGYQELAPIDDAFLARIRWGQIANMLDQL